MKMTNDEYKDYSERHMPSSPLLPDMLKAFAVGGLICCIGQLIGDLYLDAGLGKTAAATAASVTLVCYIMYCVSPEVSERFDTPYLYLTFVFVLLGLLRYIQIAVVDEKSGDPTKIILRDHFSQIIVVAWLLSFLLMIYVI